MRKITTLPIFFVVVLIITMLITFRSWLSMGLDLKLWSPLLALLIFASGFRFIRINGSGIKTMFLCLLACFTFTRGNTNAYIGAFMSILPFLVFCAFPKEIRINFLVVFNKILAVIVAISTFFWILHLLGVPLYHTLLTFGENYAYDNYFFFLDFISSISYLDFFPRFYGIFVEPSIIGMLSALMLFLDGFRLRRWYNIVYLISLILTFSLAGFVLFAVALIPYVIYNSEGRKGSRISYLLIAVTILGVGYYALYKADQSSVIYQMLGQRLEWNEDRGTISGYDRSGEAIDDFLANRFWKEGKAFWGYGPDLQYDGVDIKIFVAKYGIISLMMYIIFLFYSYWSRKSRFGLWWFFLFFMAFYRGYSIMFWPGFMMLYLMGLDYLFYLKDKKLDAWDTSI